MDHERWKTAGRNGEVTIVGNAQRGQLHFRRKVSMPPHFKGDYLDQTIYKLGQVGLERVQEAIQHSFDTKIRFKFVDSAAGMDRGDFYVGAESSWAFRRGDDINGQDMARSMENNKGALGYTFTNWLD